MPSATYGGDFETTRIPQHSPGSAPAPASDGYGVFREPEPLPYQPPGVARPAAPAPTDLYGDDFVDDRVKAAGRRGTQDFGLFLLRATMGTYLVAHGLQDAFGWWGGQGLSELGTRLSAMGFEHASILTYLAAGTQISAGLLLLLGLFTPIAAAAGLAYVLNSLLANVAAQYDAGFVGFFLPDGNEYHILLIVVLATIILAGPGRYGFDAGRGWARRPFIGSFGALLLGFGAGIGAWMLLNGTNPLS